MGSLQTPMAVLRSVKPDGVGIAVNNMTDGFAVRQQSDEPFTTLLHINQHFMNIMLYDNYTNFAI